MTRSASAYFDGRIYAWVIDPALANLRHFLARRVRDLPGVASARILDVCCGTGALARRLAPLAGEVIGLDRSPVQIAQARRALARAPLANLRFVEGDASDLSAFPDGHFGLATAVMGLHEMPAAVRPRVLGEMLRVAERVWLLDYAAPLPKNPKGLFLRGVEGIAGRRHFRGFRDYLGRGGLPALVAQAGGRIAAQRRLDRGCMQLVDCHRGA